MIDKDIYDLVEEASTIIDLPLLLTAIVENKGQCNTLVLNMLIGSITLTNMEKDPILEALEDCR